MGIETYVYVGPFIRVPGVRKTITNTNCRCSRNCGARAAPNAKFCGQCGAPITCVSTGSLELKKLHPGDVQNGKFENAFWSPEYCSGESKYEAVWISNSGHGKSFSVQDSDRAVTLDIDSAQACLDFAAKEKTMLEAIEAEYGVKPEVCWGVVPYAS